MNKPTLYESGYLRIDLPAILESLDDHAKIELADSLSCEEAIIKNVVDQILTGWTDMSSHGSISHLPDSAPFYAIDKARRDIAKMAGDVAKAEIERLEKALVAKEKECEKLREELSGRRSASGHPYGHW